MTHFNLVNIDNIMKQPQDINDIFGHGLPSKVSTLLK